MKKDGIVIHCSDSSFGSSILIDQWHRERGWDNIGYHFIICNGKIDNNTYLSCMDGSIERGRDIDKQGAHARGYNNYIGICLIGVDKFTDKQFLTLEKLITELVPKYGIDIDKVLGHNSISTKSCPNFNVDKFIQEYIF